VRKKYMSHSGECRGRKLLREWLTEYGKDELWKLWQRVEDEAVRWLPIYAQVDCQIVSGRVPNLIHRWLIWGRRRLLQEKLSRRRWAMKVRHPDSSHGSVLNLYQKHLEHMKAADSWRWINIRLNVSRACQYLLASFNYWRQAAHGEENNQEEL
jgi:hypothetical protein